MLFVHGCIDMNTMPNRKGIIARTYSRQQLQRTFSSGYVSMSYEAERCGECVENNMSGKKVGSWTLRNAYKVGSRLIH